MAKEKIRHKIHWATPVNETIVGNAYGYRIHNEELRKATAKIADITVEAEDALIILSPEMYKNRIPGMANWLFTMFEGTTLPLIYQRGIQKADFLLAPSTWVADLLGKYFDRKRVFVVPHGISRDFVFKKRLYPVSRPFRYLWIGAPNPRKGYEELIWTWEKIFKEDPMIELYVKTTLAGGAKAYKGLKEKFGQMGNVILDGRDISRKELVELYHSAHCFVFPTRGEGFGFCVGSETNVFTDDGTKKIKTINIGDKVLTEDGSFNKVKSKVKNNKEVLDFKIRGTQNIIISKEHPFLGFRMKGKNLKSVLNKKEEINLEWIKAENLNEKDLVAYPKPKLNKDLPKHFDILKLVDGNNIEFDSRYIWNKMGYSPKIKNGISYLCKKINKSEKIVYSARKHLKEKTVPKKGSKTKEVYDYLINTNYELSMPNKINRYIPYSDDFLYLLGWYLAEGSNMGGKGIEFSLSGDEYHIAFELKSIIKNLFGVESIIGFKKNSNVCSMTSCSSILGALFRAFCGNHASGKRINKELFKSGDFLHPLIKGYIMGDGHPWKDQGGYSITTASRDLVWQIRNIFASKNIYIRVSYLKKNGRGNEAWVMNVGGEDAELLCDWTGLDNRTKGNRKPHRWALKTDNFILTPISKIENIKDTQEVWDLEIENVHSFVGNGILLHNTLAEAMATGCPCISTNYSGVTDFFNSLVGYPIDYKMDEGKATFIGGKKDEREHITGIAMPDVEELVLAMAEVRMNYGIATDRAAAGSRKIKTEFTWGRAARVLMETIGVHGGLKNLKEKTLVDVNINVGMKKEGKKIITFVGYNRPKYTKQVLEGLSKCKGIGEYTILSCIEPGNEEVIQMVKGIDFAESDLTINKTRLDVNENTFQALSQGFAFSDYVIHFEDDIVPAKDCLVYFEWAKEYFKESAPVFTICAYNKIEKKKYKTNQAYKTFGKLWFTPWGWATWDTRWKDIERDWALNIDTGYSWDIFMHRKIRNVRYEIRPVLARTQNIGAEEGRNVPDAKFHEEKQFNEFWAGSFENLPEGHF